MDILSQNSASHEMQGLIFMHGITSQPYTTADVIAKCSGVDIQSINRLTRSHKVRLEKFGKVGFEIRALPSGQKGKIWHYNEQQATVLMTYLKNTPKVLNFKDALVKAFFEQRQEIQKWHQERLLNRETNKTMAQVIHDIWPDSKHQYTNFHNLVWRVAIGYTPSQFAKASGVKDAYKALASEQEKRLEQTKEAIRALIIIGHDYQQVKASLMRKVA